MINFSSKKKSMIRMVWGFAIPFLIMAAPGFSQTNCDVRCTSFCCVEEEPCCEISPTTAILGASGAGLAIGAIVGAVIGSNCHRGHSSGHGIKGPTGSQGSGPVIPVGDSTITIIFGSIFGNIDNVPVLTVQPFLTLPDLRIIPFDPYTYNDYPRVITLPAPNLEGTYILTLKVVSIDVPGAYFPIEALVGFSDNPALIIELNFLFPADPLTLVGTESSQDFVYIDQFSTP